MSTPRFAWPQFRKDWDLGISDVRFEADVAAAAELDEETRRLRLDRAGAWGAIELTFTLATTETAPDEVGELSAFVLVSSPRTQSRIPVPLVPAAGGFTGAVRLEQHQLGGSVEITAQVLGDQGVPRVVGYSQPWTLIVDPGAAPPTPGAPPFAIAWQPFGAASSSSVLQGARESYAHMDLSGVDPVLYLNEDIRGFKMLMEAKRSQSEKRRTRDILAASIVRYASATLFRRAQGQVDITEGVVTLPEDSVYKQICQLVADTVDGVDSPDELFVGLQDPARQYDLWAEVDVAIDKLSGASETVAVALGEIFDAK